MIQQEPNPIKDSLNYQRRQTMEVMIGDTPLGGKNPLRIQTMANVSTNEVELSVSQTLRVAEVGCDYMRFTAQGVREAAALADIHAQLRARGCHIPLVADIHFNPQAAYEALKHVEKVRINPGNFADNRSDKGRYASAEEWYQMGANRVSELFGAFVCEAKRLGRTLRLGVNHGSLSQRMLERWGNTPEGMVESCLEYLAVAREHNFHDLVISMKSSNVQVMTQAVRLLVARLEERGWHYPLHLGVTEAGEGEDGRIKSAVGIGSLLLDGIGDTLRVSLSESPEAELPVARQLVAHVTERMTAPPLQPLGRLPYTPYMLPRTDSRCVAVYGGSELPRVIAQGSLDRDERIQFREGDILLSPNHSLDEVREVKAKGGRFVSVEAKTLTAEMLVSWEKDSSILLLLQASGGNAIGEWRNAIALMKECRSTLPIFLQLSLEQRTAEEIPLVAAADFGTLLLEGVASGIMLYAPQISAEILLQVGLGILQATRLRFSHTEFISCPGCGRTLYDLEGTIARIKRATKHLPNLKIGIMGCIVNGPGEMADADYGYVGGAPGKIDLYKGQECLVRGIPESEAVDALIDLIRQYGDWIEPQRM